MAITIDWQNKVINVPRNDMTLVQSTPTEIRELDLNTFRLTLRDLEDDTEGMLYPTTHSHNTTVTVGGVTLARVVEIINGYTVTFEDGQYAVNLVAANSNVGDVVNVNQVSVRSANSAGLVQTDEIEYSSFQNQVTLDTVNGSAGQAYPIGTVQSPVNNLDDALFIANLRGLDKIFIKGNYTFLPTDVVDGLLFCGQSSSKTTIILTDSATITNCIFKDATISGFLDGGNDIVDCEIQNLDYIDGTVRDCELDAGTITLSGTQAQFLRCWSGVAGSAATPTIDMGGTGTNLIIRDYSGGIKLANYTSGSDAVSIDMSSGQVIFDSTVTAGVFTVRGVGKVVDNSGPGALVNVEILDSQHLNRAAFIDGAVHLNSGSALSGTAFPLGTTSKPVNNLADAITIARAEGLDRIHMVGSITATASENLDGIAVEGESGASNVLILSGASTVNASFSKLILVGALNGLSRITNCVLGTTGLGGFTGCQGRIVDCIVNNAAGVTQQSGGAGTLFDNCSFIAPDDPQITLNANGKAFSLRQCTGNILVTGATDVEQQQVNLAGARVEFAASCTAGTFIVDGHGEVIDNSDAGCTVDTQRLAAGLTWSADLSGYAGTVAGKLLSDAARDAKNAFSVAASQ